LNIHYVLIIVIAGIVTVGVLLRLVSIFKEKISFYSLGFENGLHFSEVGIVWKTLKKCGVISPLSLYDSVSTLNRCIAMIISERRRSATVDVPGEQLLIAKLNKLRTKVALQSDESQHIQTTAALEAGQRLSIIFYGRGVYSSTVLNNGRRIEVSLPKKGSGRSSDALPANMWKNRKVSVYFWRKGDACYAFDTTVNDTGIFEGHQCIMLTHSAQLDRTQKRQAIRCPCEIDADLFMLKSAAIDYNIINSDGGYKCVLDDISEYGALVRIGGKGRGNMRIKLQFYLNTSFIMMYGIIHSVEYNKEKNMSRLHFECTYIDDDMRNTLSNYIYTQIASQLSSQESQVPQLKDTEIQKENKTDEDIKNDADRVDALDEKDTSSDVADIDLETLLS